MKGEAVHYFISYENQTSLPCLHHKLRQSPWQNIDKGLLWTIYFFWKQIHIFWSKDDLYNETKLMTMLVNNILVPLFCSQLVVLHGRSSLMTIVFHTDLKDRPNEKKNKIWRWKTHINLEE